MKLYLLRHAKAKPLAMPFPTRDSDRPLTPAGASKMRRIALGLKRLKLGLDLILTSPYVRARKTAEIAANVLNKRKKLAISAHLAADAQAARLIAEINHSYSKAQSILLVGHEPFLSQLMAHLLTGGCPLFCNLKKGGLALLSLKALKFGRCATLDGFLTPRQLVQLGA